jgi:hypothetical protein
MAVFGDDKTVPEYMDEIDTGVTRESFEKAFRAFPDAELLQRKVTASQMRFFFAAADDFSRLRGLGKAKIDRRGMKADYKRCLKLITDLDKGLAVLLRRAQRIREKSLQRGPSRTGPVAGVIAEKLASVQEDFRNTLEETVRNTQMQQQLLDAISPNKNTVEFTIHLENILSSQFRDWKREDKNALFGAALAGAKAYTAEELAKSAEGKLDLLDRIRRRLSAASKHRRKFYKLDRVDELLFEAYQAIETTPEPRAQDRERTKQRRVARQRKES